MKKYSIIISLLVIALVFAITPSVKAQTNDLQSLISSLQNLLDLLRRQVLLTAAAGSSTSTSTSPLTVTYPNGGEFFYPGISRTFRWSSTLASSTEIHLSLVSEGTTTVTSSLGVSSNDGSENVYIPFWPGRYKFQVKTSASSTPVYSDMSDSSFTIESSLPQINLLSPNGGEIWLQRSTQLVRYNYSGYILRPYLTRVYISVINNNGAVVFYHPEGGTLSQGETLITVPTLSPGYYRYQVTMFVPEARGWVSDVSDNYIQITDKTMITPTVD
ncbi:MAG: hypothetical protein AAB677_02880 [Patescibacteria group bacterium]